MFETARAFDDLDEIAAMPGIDALTIGPADLAQDLGVFETPDQAKVLDEHRDRILGVRRKHGKVCASGQFRGDAALDGRRRASVGLLQRR